MQTLYFTKGACPCFKRRRQYIIMNWSESCRYRSKCRRPFVNATNHLLGSLTVYRRRRRPRCPISHHKPWPTNHTHRKSPPFLRKEPRFQPTATLRRCKLYTDIYIYIYIYIYTKTENFKDVWIYLLCEYEIATKEANNPVTRERRRIMHVHFCIWKQQVSSLYVHRQNYLAGNFCR